MRSRWFVLALAWAAAAGHAAEGLIAPQADTLWPSWQARVQLQTTGVQAPGAGSAGQFKGGAVLGDYFLARRWFGALRATSGVVVGSLAGAPLYKALPAQPHGVNGQSNGLGNGLQPGLLSATVSPTPLPYLGLGFSGAPVGSGLSFSADFGLVAEYPGSGGDLGRSLLGNQGMERAFRDLRLSPMAQLNVRYDF